jgi:hypothetical protein
MSMVPNYVDTLVINSKNILKTQAILITYKNKEIMFKSSNAKTEFIQFLIKIAKDKNKSTVFFAANLNFFALSFLQQNELLREEFEIDTLILKNTFYHLTLTHLISDKKIVFKCLTRFFPIGLENLSDKLKTEYEFSNKIYNITVETYLTEENSFEILKKNKQFCYEILKELNITMVPFLKNWTLATYSMAGIALEIFKKHYNDFGIKISQTASDYKRFKVAYKAGRNEIYGNPIPGDFIYHFDFPNMYGSVMEEELFFGKWQLTKTNEFSKDGIYHAIVTTENIEIPVISTKIPNQVGNFYINGTFTDFFTKEELELFVAQGGKILRIIELFEFDNKAKLFATYVKTLQALRKNSNLSNYIFKNLLVSFYGRLGMGILDQKEILVSQEDYKNINEDTITAEMWVGSLGIIQVRESKITTQENLYKKIRKEYHSIIEGKIAFQQQKKIFLNINFIETKPQSEIPFLSSNELQVFNLILNLPLNFEGNYEESKEKIIKSFYAKTTNVGLSFEIKGVLTEREENFLITVLIWKEKSIALEFLFESPNLVKKGGEKRGVKWFGIFTKNNKLPSNVILAAQITAKARIKLYKLFLEIQALGGRILYCHTDSVFVAFKFNILNRKNPRLLELFGAKNAQLKDAVFASTQVYALKYLDGSEVIKISGINTTNIKFDDFKQAFYSSSSLKTTFTTMSNVWLFNNNEVECFISMTNYNKREFSKDKSTTRPFYLENGHLRSNPKF